MNFIIPGLRNSGPDHWQSIWEKRYPEQFKRIEQDNWQKPDCSTWIQRIEEVLRHARPEEAILVGHSVGCAAIVHWFRQYGRPIKGALLVAPSDVDRPDYPSYITGFAPIPLEPLPFKSIVVASTNDHVVRLKRARYFAECWGSEPVELKGAGHIEPKSGYGEWPEGLELLKRLS
ncbi:RBBP9/YdeN family alpha/beta hydrolase [Nafulsella turpanensis]|uniref:RBBP9/YdeN family alpha/beta hydrolase n=1 Tax=Nafulsella turpanensis TaxID=1265690 RepID=UPI00034C3B49|nr:alpha/beta hydrolase [Nafulsella turpanensis]